MEKQAWNSPLFRNMEPEDVQTMLHCLNAREVTAEKGAFLLRSGGETPLIGLVLEGAVQIISEDCAGKRSLLAVLPAGSIFGESYSCLRAENRTLAYQTNEKSRVLLLDYERILHSCKLVCRFHHRMVENMVEMIAAKYLDIVVNIVVL